MASSQAEIQVEQKVIRSVEINIWQKFSQHARKKFHLTAGTTRLSNGEKQNAGTGQCTGYSIPISEGSLQMKKR